MHVFDIIAEDRIQKAIERGDFDNLPGAGKPLELDDDLLVPEVLRVAYRILKNAGFVPPEIEAQRDIAELQTALTAIDDEDERSYALAKLHYLQLKLSHSHPDQRSLRIEAQYFEKIVERLGKRRR